MDNKNKFFKKGNASVPIILGLILTAFALPAGLRLVQQNQETRRGAADAYSGDDLCETVHIWVQFIDNSDTVEEERKREWVENNDFTGDGRVNRDDVQKVLRECENCCTSNDPCSGENEVCSFCAEDKSGVKYGTCKTRAGCVPQDKSVYSWDIMSSFGTDIALADYCGEGGCENSQVQKHRYWHYQGCNDTKSCWGEICIPTNDCSCSPGLDDPRLHDSYLRQALEEMGLETYCVEYTKNNHPADAPTEVFCDNYAENCEAGGWQLSKKDGDSLCGCGECGCTEDKKLYQREWINTAGEECGAGYEEQCRVPDSGEGSCKSIPDDSFSDEVVTQEGFGKAILERGGGSPINWLSRDYQIGAGGPCTGKKGTWTINGEHSLYYLDEKENVDYCVVIVHLEQKNPPAEDWSLSDYVHGASEPDHPFGQVIISSGVEKEVEDCGSQTVLDKQIAEAALNSLDFGPLTYWNDGVITKIEAVLPGKAYQAAENTDLYKSVPISIDAAAYDKGKTRLGVRLFVENRSTRPEPNSSLYFNIKGFVHASSDMSNTTRGIKLEVGEGAWFYGWYDPTAFGYGTEKTRGIAPQITVTAYYNDRGQNARPGVILPASVMKNVKLAETFECTCSGWHTADYKFGGTPGQDCWDTGSSYERFKCANDELCQRADCSAVSCTYPPCHCLNARCGQSSGGNPQEGEGGNSAESTCSQRSQGDADCNGVVNAADFSIWRKEKFDQGADETKGDWQSDFNRDGFIKNDDFSIWLNNLE